MYILCYSKQVSANNLYYTTKRCKLANNAYPKHVCIIYF